MQRTGFALIGCVIALTAACFSDRGVAIEIDVGDTRATSVELYVGISACSESATSKFRCNGGIAPPDFTSHLAGTVWFRDDLVPYRATVRGGTATFRLQADEDTELPIAIAVGTNNGAVTGTATLSMVSVPADSGLVAKATLVAAGEVTPTTTAATEDRALIWEQPGDAASTCVVVEHWSAGKATRVFIVPPDDPDCDRVDRECDPAAANGEINRNGVDAQPECFVAADSGENRPPCQLGAFGCSDENGPRLDQCLTTRRKVCVPEPFCECTGPTPDQFCPAAKLRDGAELARIPHLECTVRVAPALVSLRPVACADTSERIDLMGQLGHDGCSQPKLSGIRLSDLASGSRSHNFGGADLELIDADNNCAFRVQVNRDGTHEPDVDELGLITLAVEDNGPAVVLPVIFHFSLQLECGPEKVMDCRPIELGDDPMWGCVP